MSETLAQRAARIRRETDNAKREKAGKQADAASESEVNESAAGLAEKMKKKREETPAEPEEDSPLVKARKKNLKDKETSDAIKGMFSGGKTASLNKKPLFRRA